MQVVQPWGSIPEGLWTLHPSDFEKAGLGLKSTLPGARGWIKDLQKTPPVQVSQWSHTCRAGVTMGRGAPAAAPALQGCTQSVQEPAGLPGAAAGRGGVGMGTGGGEGQCCKTLDGFWTREKPQEYVSSLRNKSLASSLSITSALA